MITTVRSKRPAMTAAEARAFAGYSVANSAIIRMALKCQCEPYEDTFTYRRWQALGRQVRRGERGIAIPVIYDALADTQAPDASGESEQTARRIRTTAYVFCRCQTDAAA